MLSSIQEQVWNILVTHGELTIHGIHQHAPTLKFAQIKYAIKGLCNYGRAESTGLCVHTSARGPNPALYRAIRKTTVIVEPSSAPLAPGAGRVVRYRDDKIDLLRRLVRKTHDRDRDTLIGILADYGGKA